MNGVPPSGADDLLEEDRTPSAQDGLIELELIAPIQGGQMLARVDGRLATFVHGGAPGERVAARIVARKRNYWEAEAVSVAEPSSARVEPPCPYYGENGRRRGAITARTSVPGPVCGGCQYQHLSYEAQLASKATVLRDVLRRLGKILDPPVAATLPSPTPYGYRNKASWLITGDGAPAYRTAGSHTAVPIESCQLLTPSVHAVLQAVQAGAQEIGLAGLVTELEARLLPDGQGTDRGTLVLSLAPTTGQEEAMALAEALMELCPGIVGVVGLRGYDVAPNTLAGDPVLSVPFLDELLTLSATSFFQINLPQAEVLVRYVLEHSGIMPGHQVLDVFSGVGSFTLPLARHAEAVIGFEIDPGAVADARQSIARAGLDNITLLEGDAAVNLRAILPGTAQCLVLDPPRAGCDQETLRQITRIRVPRVLYVSCDAATLARDLRVLLDHGYELESVQPVDLFPQTAHIESISLLRLPRKYRVRR